MKKLVVILFLVVYGSATMGATIHMHYCMDRLVDWSLWETEEDSTCGLCGMKEKKGGCCDEKQEQIKLNTEHQKSGVSHDFQFLSTPVILNKTIEFNFQEVQIALNFPVSNAPPKVPIEKLYMLHGAFLI